MSESHEYFFDGDPNELPLGARMVHAGLLPGDEAWVDDIPSYVDSFLEDWVTGFDINTEADVKVYNTGVAQVRRLLPGMTQRDRDMVRIGLVVGQAWLYTYLTVIANATQGGRLSPNQLALMNYMEYRITTLCSMIGAMGDDVDMTNFEEKL